jgi:hypothetical protein
LGAIFDGINGNTIFYMIKFINILLLVMLAFISCKDQAKKTIESKEITNYKVQISYSSFFDCGDYKKILIDNNWESDPVYKNTIKNLHLYKFDIANNCNDKAKIDTQAIGLTVIQSDSIFKLANMYVDNFKIYNPEAKGMKIIIMDGSDVKVEVCYENKCKTVMIHHYDKLPKDFLKLENYIDSIK